MFSEFYIAVIVSAICIIAVLIAVALQRGKQRNKLIETQHTFATENQQSIKRILSEFEAILWSEESQPSENRTGRNLTQAWIDAFDLLSHWYAVEKFRLQKPQKSNLSDQLNGLEDEIREYHRVKTEIALTNNDRFKNEYDLAIEYFDHTIRNRFDACRIILTEATVTR